MYCNEVVRDRGVVSLMNGFAYSLEAATVSLTSTRRSGAMATLI